MDAVETRAEADIPETPPENRPRPVNRREDCPPMLFPFSDLGNAERLAWRREGEFLWTKATGMQDLGTYPGDIGSAAISINDQGVIAGLSVIDANGDSRAVVWNNGVLTDLNTLVQANPPLYLITACAINNIGEISGLGVTSSGEIHTYRAAPIQNGYSVERQQ